MGKLDYRPEFDEDETVDYDPPDDMEDEFCDNLVDTDLPDEEEPYMMAQLTAAGWFGY